METIEDAINGAKDILAEHISDEADYRIYLRKLTMDKGTVVSAAKILRNLLFMRCTMNLKNQSKNLQDIVCLR